MRKQSSSAIGKITDVPIQPGSTGDTTTLSRRIIDMVPGLIGVYNIHTGTYIYINSTLKNMLGYDVDEWVQKGVSYVSSLIHPDDIGLLLKKNNAALIQANEDFTKTKGNNPIVSFEYRIKHKNGSWRWLKTDGIIFERDKNKKVISVMNISVDITKRKEKEMQETHKRLLAETILKESEELFHTAFNQSAVAMALTDAAGNWISVNQMFPKMFGFSQQSLKKIHPQSLVFSQDKTGYQAQMKKLIQGSIKTLSEEVRFTHKNGSIIYTIVHATTVRDPSGRVKFLSLAIQDISKRKIAETNLQENNSIIQSILESTTDAIYVKDTQGKYLLINSAGADFLGRQVNQIIGRTSRDIMPQQTASEFSKNDQIVLREGKPFSFEESLFKNGKVQTFLAAKSPLKNIQGKIIGLIGISRDITVRKQQERYKDEFMGIVSHELKTPVTSLKAYTQVLKKKLARNGETTFLALLTKMDAQINKLAKLINDLLDITKIEGGKVRFNLEKFSFSQLLGEIIDEVQRTTQTHEIILIKKQHIHIYADRDRIGQVVTNLLTNAIKYSPRANRVFVSLQTEKKQLKVSVQDFGMGIAKEKQHYVFKRFYRSNGNSDLTFPGIGLGLYISEEIIKRHGGKIWVESEQEKGSIFHFTLPLE